MKTSKTYSLLFWLYTQNLEPGYAQIYLRITVDSRRTNLSIKKKIPIDKWDSKKSKAKGNSKEARILNNFLDAVRSDISTIHQNLLLQEVLITSKLMKAIYLGHDDTKKSLKDLVAYHNQSIENKIHRNTFSSYQTSQGYLFKFVEEKLKTNDIYLKDISYSFIISYETYLRNFKDKYGNTAIQNNTVMKHVQRLRKIIRLGVKLEWLKRDPFLRYEPTFEKKVREFLSESEIQKISIAEISIDRLCLVRDLFVFSCYTGLSYIDIANLNINHIHKGIDGNNWIITKRQKTSTAVRIPVLPLANIILEKYINTDFPNTENTVFPKISNQKLNSYLKELADICGITKNLTFHMARHTFATTITLSNGVPIETVSKMLGHTKIATTQIYARVLDNKVSNDMNNLQQILNNKGATKNNNHNNLAG